MANLNGNSTNGNANWHGNFLARVTPGNWITIVMVVAAGIISWQNTKNQIGNQTKELIEVKAQIVALAPKESVGQITNQVESINTRLASLTDRINVMGQEIAVLREIITELRRQSQLRSSSPVVPSARP